MIGMSQNTDTTMDERGAAAAAADSKRVVVMGERIKVKKRSNFETFIKFGTDACEFDALPSHPPEPC